jgi:hypothetical protein
LHRTPFAFIAKELVLVGRLTVLEKEPLLDIWTAFPPLSEESVITVAPVGCVIFSTSTVATTGVKAKLRQTKNPPINPKTTATSSMFFLEILNLLTIGEVLLTFMTGSSVGVSIFY